MTGYKFLVYAAANEALPLIGVCFSATGSHPCPEDPSRAELAAWHLVTVLFVLAGALQAWHYWRSWPSVHAKGGLEA